MVNPLNLHRACLLALAAIGSISCDADLESQCREGTCGGGLAPPTNEQFVCEHHQTCGLPCNVYDNFVKICQTCHVEGGIAPFPLLSYDDTQQMYGTKIIWERMERAVQPGASLPAMPQGNNPLTIDSCGPNEDQHCDYIDYFNEWFPSCHTPEGCATGEGIGGESSDDVCRSPGEGGAGAGGAGGAGGGTAGAGGAGGG